SAAARDARRSAASARPSRARAPRPRSRTARRSRSAARRPPPGGPRRSCLVGSGQPQALPRAGRVHEAREQRMAAAWLRRELRTGLRGEEPRVPLELVHLDEAVARAPGQLQPGALELLLIAVVELVAVTVALGDLRSAVHLAREAAFAKEAGLR